MPDTPIVDVVLGGELVLLPETTHRLAAITPVPTADITFPPVQTLPDDVGATVLVRHGDRVLITAPSTEAAESEGPGELLGDTGRRLLRPLKPEALPRDVLADLTDDERLGVEALELRQSARWRSVKLARPRAGEEWDMPTCAPVQTEPIRLDQLLGGTEHAEGEEVDGAAPEAFDAPLGAPPAEGLNDFLEGPVGLAVVIVNGPTAALQFTAAERTKVLAEVQEGLVYLAGANPSAHVSFSVESHTVNLTVANATNLAEDTWRNAAMGALGYAAEWASVARLARDVRDRTRSRWGYVLFMTKYNLWHFAYASNDRIVMQYANDGWGVDNIDRVFAHESGHIFGAPDEYASASCNTGGAHGRFGEPNRNCEVGNPGSVNCLMKANTWALCASTVRHFGWGLDRFRAPHTAAPLTITSMKTDSLTVLGADNLGDIRFASWEGGPAWWQGWTYLLRGQTSPGGHVTAVSRRPGYLDVFTVGLDGRVWTAAYDTSNRWKGWWPIGTLRAPVGSYVGAVSRRQDYLDIFVVDTAGRVMTAWWSPVSGGWQGWYQIRGGLAAPGAPVTAVSRSLDKLDIFVVGTDNRVYTAAWEPAFTDWWHGWWRIGTSTTTPRAMVSVVSRRPDYLDVFMTDSARRIVTGWWSPVSGGWQAWHQIRGGLAAPGSPVHAVSRSRDKLDIFVAGTNGATYSAAWEPAFTDWWHGWWHLKGGVTGVGGTVAAVSRSADKLDIVTIGTDRRPFTAAWAPGMSEWWGWYAMGS